MSSSDADPDDSEPTPADASIFDIGAQKRRRLEVESARAQRKQAATSATTQVVAGRITAARMRDAPDEALDDLLQMQELVRAQLAALTLTAHEHWRRRATAYFGTERTFSLAYLDPPWSYKSDGVSSGTGAHYGAMSDGELARMPIRGLMKQDAVLAMWATAPKLDVAHRLLETWGFTFRTVFLTWIKVTASGQRPIYSSQGAYTRPNAEYLLVAVRGSLQVAKRTRALLGSVLETRRAEHSHKPNCVRDMLVTVFGDHTRIELFARETIPGWAVWGNETSKFNELYAQSNGVVRRDAAEVGGADEEFTNGNKRLLKIRPGRTRANNLSAKPTKTDKSLTLPVGRVERGAESTNAYYNKPSAGMKMTKNDFTVRGYDNSALRMLNHVPDVRAFLCGTGVSVRDERHTTYSRMTVREAAARAELIRRAQEHNDEMLFAVNYNVRPRRAFVRYSDADMASVFTEISETRAREQPLPPPAAKAKTTGKRKRGAAPVPLDNEEADVIL